MITKRYWIGALTAFLICLTPATAAAQAPAGGAASQDTPDIKGFSIGVGYSPMHYDEKSYHADVEAFLDWLLDSDWDLYFGFDLMHTAFGTGEQSIGATSTSYMGGVQYNFWGEDDGGPFGARARSLPFAAAAAAQKNRPAFLPFVYGAAGLNHEFGANGFLMQFGGGVKKRLTDRLLLRLQADVRIVRVGGFTAKGFGGFFGVELPFTHKAK